LAIARLRDAARFCDALKPRCNIHAVPEDVMGLDNYVTDIDAHPESNPPVVRIAGRKFFDAGLELRSSTNRFDCARKLRQEPVAGVLHDATAMVADC
jgi:hypothetical protein